MVQPIRDKKKIDAMKEILKARNDKYYVMFMIGINSGLRVSDILKLRVKDVKDRDISIYEKKTGKYKQFRVTKPLRECLDEYIKEKNLKDDDYLIPSRQGDHGPITTVQAYMVLREAGEAVGLKDIGTHTMRKTFGYWHYKQFHDVAMLQRIFNHASPSVTLRYIGVTQDEINATYDQFGL